MFNESDSRRRR